LEEVIAMPVDPRVVDLLLRYEELRGAGRSPTPEEMCADCPELLDEVRRRLGHIVALDRHLGPTHIEDAPAADPDAWTGEARSALSYRLVRFHAKGGLGEVHLAEDAALRRRVALKRMRPPHAADPYSRRRFLREAEVTARLEHPGVVTVYSLVEGDGGQPGYAMRFIEGESLKDALDRFHQADRKSARDAGGQALGLRELLGRFVGVCNTVAYAHSRGILHRDLKPANVMLGRYSETLVVDWGLAKPVERSEEDRAGGEETLMPTPREGEEGTRTGQALGTPAYMSPEQASGDWAAVGPASDVYGLGAVLYCLLTGQAPFTGPDKREVMRRVRVGEFPRPGLVKPGVPRPLEAVCLKAMALQPADRYAGALELRNEVERWLAGEPVSAYPEPLAVRLGRWARRHPARLGAAAAGVAVALLAGAGAWLWIAEERAARRAQTDRTVSAALGKAQQLAEQAEKVEVADPAKAAMAVALWKQARDAAQQADDIAAGGLAGLDTARLAERLLAELRTGVAQARRDGELLSRLDEARLARSVPKDLSFDKEASAPAYAQALKDYGLDVLRQEPTAAARAVRALRRGVRGAVVVALDDWARFESRIAVKRRLLRVADLADSDP
jgi:serine/threonine protein kinase